MANKKFDAVINHRGRGYNYGNIYISSNKIGYIKRSARNYYKTSCFADETISVKIYDRWNPEGVKLVESYIIDRTGESQNLAL